MNKFKYTLDNKRYHTYNYHLKTKFNSKVAKVSINAGFTCPNRDGKIDTKGCLYCSLSGSGDFAGDKKLSITNQFYQIKALIDNKWPNAKYIAYFQAFSNTYAPLSILKAKYEEALSLPNVVGLNIATRPDCITRELVNYLQQLSTKTYLTIELGLQSIHQKTMQDMNLGYDLNTFTQTVKLLRQHNINVIVHIINGLPNENKAMMIDTTKYLNNLNIQGIKIHMLHIIHHTPLAIKYLNNPWPLLTKEAYVDIVTEQLAVLDESIIIHRLTGDAKIEDLIAPKWVIKKVSVINDIDKSMVAKKYYQGCKKEA